MVKHIVLNGRIRIMKNITLEQLLEAGCHFGHQVTRQNPKARDFVYEARDGIHIIDLGMTKQGLDAAATYVKSVAQNGGTMVVVGSKRQAAPIILAEVKRAKDTLKEKSLEDGLFTVTARWIGGTLTNATEVAKNYQKLKDITAKLKDEFERVRYTKKEIGMWEKEKQKLEMFYSGIMDIKKLPDVVFIVDTHLEEAAVMETVRMHIPSVGVVDTNADPTNITHPIPANDDAVGSLQLIISHIIDAWVEGKEEKKPEPEKEEKKTEEKKEEAEVKKEAAEKPVAKKVTKKTATVKKEKKTEEAK